MCIRDRYNSNGDAISKTFEKNVVLGIIDNEWKEHLREMDDLRSAVHHAQMEQKDPLLIYKLESFELFKQMLARMNNESLDLLIRMDIPAPDQIQTTNQSVQSSGSYAKAAETSSSDHLKQEQFEGSEGYSEAVQNSVRRVEKQQPVVAEKKVGRNDPCPCGSGKKFKQCHGK